MLFTFHNREALHLRTEKKLAFLAEN